MHRRRRRGTGTRSRQESHFDPAGSSRDRSLFSGNQSRQSLYLAGQIAIDPKTNQVMSNGSIEEQTRRVLDSLSQGAWGGRVDHGSHRLDNGLPQRR